LKCGSPESILCTIEPHAIVFDGFRWNARAFDVEASGWRDFVLGRLSCLSRLEAPSETTAGDDADCQGNGAARTVAANPGLSSAQRRLIERDYGMHRGKLVITVRKALQFYTKLTVGLDLDGKVRLQKDQESRRPKRTNHLGMRAISGSAVPNPRLLIPG